MIAQPTSLSNGSHTRWPVLACTTETWLPGQSRSANFNRLTSTPRRPSRQIKRTIAQSRFPDGLLQSIASMILVTSAGSHTDGILACLLDLAAGTVSSTPRSVSPSPAANRRSDRTAHSLCSTVLDW